MAIALAIFAPRAVHGQPRATGATAQAQFDYGVAAMEAGHYDEGCPALAESYRIDPHPGALFTLAECENRWGKLASALTHYDAYLDLYRHMSAAQKVNQRGRDRVSTAEQERLTTEVPRLSVALAPNAPPGTTITRDGVPLAEPSLGAALPVDPGEHVLVTRAPGQGAVEARVTLRVGEHRDITVDWRGASENDARIPGAALEARTAGRAGPDSGRTNEGIDDSGRASPTRVGGAIAAAPPLGQNDRERARERTGVIVGAVGAAGLALGAAAGIVVLGDRSSIDGHCRPDHTCDPRGLRAAVDASTWGTVSTVAFAAGTVGVATGAALWLVARIRRPAPPGGTLSGVVPVAGALADRAFFGVHATW